MANMQMICILYHLVSTLQFAPLDFFNRHRRRLNIARLFDAFVPYKKYFQKSFFTLIQVFFREIFIN